MITDRVSLNSFMAIPERSLTPDELSREAWWLAIADRIGDRGPLPEVGPIGNRWLAE